MSCASKNCTVFYLLCSRSLIRFLKVMVEKEEVFVSFVSYSCATSPTLEGLGNRNLSFLMMHASGSGQTTIHVYEYFFGKNVGSTILREL